jgi:hypothetical protein
VHQGGALSYHTAMLQPAFVSCALEVSTIAGAPWRFLLLQVTPWRVGAKLLHTEVNCPHYKLSAVTAQIDACRPQYALYSPPRSEIETLTHRTFKNFGFLITPYSSHNIDTYNTDNCNIYNTASTHAKTAM